MGLRFTVSGSGLGSGGEERARKKRSQNTVHGKTKMTKVSVVSLRFATIRGPILRVSPHFGPFRCVSLGFAAFRRDSPCFTLRCVSLRFVAFRRISLRFVVSLRFAASRCESPRLVTFCCVSQRLAGIRCVFAAFRCDSPRFAAIRSSSLHFVALRCVS